MDSRMFRITTEPNYYPAISASAAGRTATRTVVSPRNSFPAPDSRFPGWAAPNDDGRLVTDYRPHCSTDIPAGRQFATVQFLQRNAEDVIQTARRRQAEVAGAIFPFDKTVVPPPANVNSCTPMGCELTYTAAPEGIGMERAGAAAPPLFGTFTFPPNRPEPRPHVGINQLFEGGRNTARGRQFTPIGLGPVRNYNPVPMY